MNTKTVSCPTCKKKVKWDESSKWRPFCSERCRLIDLGAWADEDYAIPCAQPAEDFANELENSSIDETIN